MQVRGAEPAFLTHGKVVVFHLHLYVLLLLHQCKVGLISLNTIRNRLLQFVTESMRFHDPTFTIDRKYQCKMKVPW